ncbi:MAG: hypothetical protein QNJ97_13870 [Myxococcota bacterium]|nr:hypothetical protein [Myxococcota bacterium]
MIPMCLLRRYKEQMKGFMKPDITSRSETSSDVEINSDATIVSRQSQLPDWNKSGCSIDASSDFARDSGSIQDRFRDGPKGSP